MEIEAKNKRIVLSGIDEGNIVKGLAILVDTYADGLKKIAQQVELNGNILECENSAMDGCIEEIKSVSNTLTYFCESEDKTK